MTMKRSREVDVSDHITAMASNYLMLLSAAAAAAGGGGSGGTRGEVARREFTCKTCNRQFSSFQALGGHRASHKKPKHLAGEPASPPKPKIHECSVCGMEFPIGQALGGHMRRHRAATVDDRRNQAEETSLSLSLSTSPPPETDSRRVVCMDLNLTPLENKFVFGKFAPAVDCFF